MIKLTFNENMVSVHCIHLDKLLRDNDICLSKHGNKLITEEFDDLVL